MLTVCEPLIVEKDPRSSQKPPKGLTGKIYPDGRISLAYRGLSRPRRSSRDKGDRADRACQQSLTHASAPSKGFRPRGQQGITSYGRRMVRCCAALLERATNRVNLTFGTATLPALSPSDLTLVLDQWAVVVNRFFEELSRLYGRSGLSWSCIYVTEIQPRRWERSGEVALHLHWLCPGRSNRRAKWVVSPKQVAAIWARVLANILGHTPDCRAAIRLESPRGSVSRELGKYLSKGCQCVAQIVRSGQAHLLPSAWWGGTRKLKASVEASVVWLDRDQCLNLLDRQDELRAAKLAWVLHHFIDRHDADNLQPGDRRFWVGATIGFTRDPAVVPSLIEHLTR